MSTETRKKCLVEKTDVKDSRGTDSLSQMVEKWPSRSRNTFQALEKD